MKLHSKNYLYDPLIGNFLCWLLGALIMMPYINDWNSSPWLPVLGMFVGSFWSVWLHAYRESVRIEVKKKTINHTSRFLIRALIFIIISFLSHLLIVCACRDMILPALACTFYLGSIFWLEFDFMLNHHRGKPWDYRSKSDNAAKSDRIFQERRMWWFTTKVALFIFGTALYYRVLRIYLE